MEWVSLVWIQPFRILRPMLYIIFITEKLDATAETDCIFEISMKKYI